MVWVLFDFGQDAFALIFDQKLFMTSFASRSGDKHLHQRLSFRELAETIRYTCSIPPDIHRKKCLFEDFQNFI
jgi:hypothetical protein